MKEKVNKMICKIRTDTKNYDTNSGPKVIFLFMLNELSTNFFMLINVKMPTNIYKHDKYDISKT